MALKTYQVYLNNSEKKITRTFRSVSDPERIGFRRFRDKVELVTPKDVAAFEGYFDRREDAYFTKTRFPDVYLLTCEKGVLDSEDLPKCIREVDTDPNFDEAIKLWNLSKDEHGVILLERLPRIREALLRRLNLECKIFGIQGKSLFAPMDSIWVDVPSVTILSNPQHTHFSNIFPRKREAWYQEYFVKTYLYDPTILKELRAMDFCKNGRAAPDITCFNIESFLNLIRMVNKEQEAQGRPPIGFCNPFFYLCAHMFSREEVRVPSEFPDSYTFWLPTVGLGKILPERLLYEVERLRFPNPIFKRKRKASS